MKTDALEAGNSFGWGVDVLEDGFRYVSGMGEVSCTSSNIDHLLA